MLKFERGRRFGEIFDYLRAEEPPTNVPRLDRLNESEFRSNFAKKSLPFILTTGESKPKSDDPIAEIKRQCGDRIIKVRQGDYVSPENYAPEKRQLVEMSVSNYIDGLVKSLNESLRPYAGNFNLPPEFADLLGATAPAFYAQSRYEAPTVWLGSKGCVTPLHRDSSDNFAIHLVGTKRWTIFPPHDAPFLYMSSVAASKGGDFATSAVDLRKPDLERFPLFRNARPITVDLAQGETLYLPMGWGHYVETLTTSLMINYWLSIEPNGIAALGP